MASVLRISPALQRYAWGSPEGIPALLGIPVDGTPIAEAWWGAHPAAPSAIETPGTPDQPVSHEHGPGRPSTLDAVIAADPPAALGEASEILDGLLPFLLKVLAIAKPLSIQVHPGAEVARTRFAEQAGGTGTFSDPNHKPEMVVALTPMRLLAGFRAARALRADLMLLSAPGADRLLEAIESPSASDDLEEYVEVALTDIEAEPLLAELVRVANRGEGSPALAAAARVSLAHPGDAGALVALAMNPVELAPGQAAYVSDGIVHCYESGLALEIMANSDNVVRAGLTPKPIDVPLLLELAHTEPNEPIFPAPLEDGASRTFVTPASEFQLALVTDGTAHAAAGPRIVLTLDGECRVRVGEQELVLAAGQAVFVPDSDGPARIEADGMAAVASVPIPE